MRLAALEEQAGRPDLWNDREGAEKLLREKRSVEREVSFFTRMEQGLEDAGVLLDLALEEDDHDALVEVGGRLVDRELGVQPSIRVRAGAPVRVMITRDLILEPYRR